MEGMLSPPARNGGLADPLLANGDGNKRRAGASSKDKNKYWVPVDDEEEVAADEEHGGKECRRLLLYRTFKVKGILLQTYR
jgi:1,4-beta-D-xylan synthase